MLCREGCESCLARLGGGGEGERLVDIVDTDEYEDTDLALFRELRAASPW